MSYTDEHKMAAVQCLVNYGAEYAEEKYNIGKTGLYLWAKKLGVKIKKDRKLKKFEAKLHPLIVAMRVAQ